MSADGLSLIAGSVLSLVFSYVPTLNAKFAALSAELKRTIMLGLLVVVAAGVYGLGCLGWASSLGIVVTCDQQGLFALLRALVLAIIANQSLYGVSPKTGAVQEARSNAQFEALSG